MNTFLKVFLFLTTILYVALSIKSGNWNPFQWTEPIRNDIVGLLFVDLLFSWIISWFISE